jgi:hypothetical protein
VNDSLELCRDHKVSLKSQWVFHYLSVGNRFCESSSGSRNFLFPKHWGCLAGCCVNECMHSVYINSPKWRAWEWLNLLFNENICPLLRTLVWVFICIHKSQQLCLLTLFRNSLVLNSSITIKAWYFLGVSNYIFAFYSVLRGFHPICKSHTLWLHLLCHLCLSRIFSLSFWVATFSYFKLRLTSVNPLTTLIKVIQFL